MAFSVCGVAAPAKVSGVSSPAKVCGVSAPAAGGGWVLPVNEIDITAAITYGAAWNDVDLSAYVPAGTTMVQLHIRNSSATTAYTSGARYNGSADDQTRALSSLFHTSIVAFLDANRVFEGYFDDASLLVAITAYTDTATANTAFVNVSPSTGDAWTDKDISASVPAGSTVAFILRGNTGRYHKFRANGSAMDTGSVYAVKEGGGMSVAIVGLDANRVYEYYIDAGYNNLFFLAGADSEITELSDKQDKTPASDTTWVDCDCSAFIPAGAKGALVMLHPLAYDSSAFICNVRAKTGSPDNFVTDTKMFHNQGIFILVALDANRVFQAYTQDKTVMGIYVIGYIPG